MDLLERMVRTDPSVNVIMVSDHYSPDSAVEAIKEGRLRLSDKADRFSEASSANCRLSGRGRNTAEDARARP